MVKDLIPTLLGKYIPISTTYMVIATWAIFIVPLTLIKDVSSLAYVSGISLALSALLAAVIITAAPFRQTVQDHGGFWQVTVDYGFRPHCFTTISIFTEVRSKTVCRTLSYSSLYNELIFIHSLRHRCLHGNTVFFNS